MALLCFICLGAFMDILVFCFSKLAVNPVLSLHQCFVFLL